MTVISMASARQRRAMSEDAKYNQALGAEQGPPPWQDDIALCCAYARMMKAEYEMEHERIHFELGRDHGGRAWWNAPQDIQDRVHVNNHLWKTYMALCVHIAELPAKTRGEARNKRFTIGKNWLKPGNAGFRALERMREGCLADDHLFPPSLRLARLKGEAHIS